MCCVHKRYLEQGLAYSKHLSNCFNYVDFTSPKTKLHCNFSCLLILIVNDPLFYAKLHLFKKTVACISLQTCKKLKSLTSKVVVIVGVIAPHPSLYSPEGHQSTFYGLWGLMCSCEDSQVRVRIGLCCTILNVKHSLVTQNIHQTADQ